MAFQKQLPKKSEDLSAWYNAVILQSELADYGPAKGTMIFRPYGYAIWEIIQRHLDADIKRRGVENAYFPMFIPEHLLHKEKEHVQGFSPELAVVTIGGGEKLQEPLVVRPTSETIMYDTFARWVQSWRDLPLQINQWNNVVRWEKRTYLFLRTTEFLWQEGHTVHATHDEALATVHWAMDTYKNLYRDVFALPGYIGRKSDGEKFAGADMTLTYETLMPEGKALQSCTSHDLGQNFAKSFDIQFQSPNGVQQYAWQTSWGLSTRSIGGLIMAHGDDKGLRLPPKLAPVQIVILPVRAEEEIIVACREIAATLQREGFRVKVDDEPGQTIGWKFNKWELRGVPLRIEVGKRELEEGVLTIARRDTGEKVRIRIDDLPRAIGELLGDIQATLLAQADAFLQSSTHEVRTWEEFKTYMNAGRGFLRSYWCGSRDCESQIKEETKATTRCFSGTLAGGTCIRCGKETEEQWYFAQAY
ncbi:proline--tRNA ligase [Candidatus Uhrbacteria bacterium]|nr:proline--tRNA ligase [Candidatus Uhrbacteria bacterium]